MRFWNGARTASQIAQCYYQELGYNGYCTISSDLIGYWKLNEGAGKSIIDYSGGGNTGTKYYCENTDIDAPPIESIGDGIGDDDGICEAGEVCTDPNESDGAYGITVATGQGCSSPPTSTEWTGGWVAGKSF
ncbi:MAG: hypothetical protein HZA10_09815 [Nitrospirae bacterium]|nr:hypothetical protein [Nitrospirota bacterium]